MGNLFRKQCRIPAGLLHWGEKSMVGQRVWEGDAERGSGFGSSPRRSSEDWEGYLEQGGTTWPADGNAHAVPQLVALTSLISRGRTLVWTSCEHTSTHTSQTSWPIVTLPLSRCANFTSLRLRFLIHKMQMKLLTSERCWFLVSSFFGMRRDYLKRNACSFSSFTEVENGTVWIP